MPFLSVITRTYKRPKMFAVNRKTLREQSCKDFEEIVFDDPVGIGIAKSHRNFWVCEPQGDYVWVYDDDNIIVDPDFIKKAKDLADRLQPDVILIKGWVVGNILPDKWPLEVGHVDTMNFIVSKKIWMQHRKDWHLEYAGDWAFISEVMKRDPMVVWLDTIACKTIRGSRGMKEEWDFEVPSDVMTVPKLSVRESIHVGDTVKATEARAGVNFFCKQGQEFLITESNFEICENLMRAGKLLFVSAGNPQQVPTLAMSNKKVLIFCPIGSKLEPETREAIFNQKGVEYCDIMFTQDNPYPLQGGEVMRNVQHNYEKMRHIVLERGYEKVWICEADMIPPDDALQRLLEVDAPIVTGLYSLRHGPGSPNILRKLETPTGFNWNDIASNWGQTIECGGGCMGCVLIDRSVLESFSFIIDKPIPPDTPFMSWCVAKKIKQMARLDVVCGHKNPDGSVLWPDKQLQVKKEKAA